MKFTDSYFMIPVRVFNTELEDYDETDDFGIGWARIHYGDLYACTWHEGYSTGTIGLSTKTEGFGLTIIRTPNWTYTCTWPMKEFEKKLNIFMAKVEIEQEAEDQTEEDLEL